MDIDPEREATLQRYRGRLAQFGRDPATLGWRQGSQERRFAAFHRWIADAPPRDLLDVGCGFADLLPYLRERGWQGDYCGLDLVPEFVEIAQELHLGDQRADFFAGDLFAADLGDRRFEAVFACGLCNHNRGELHLDFVRALLDRTAEVATDRIAVDFLSATSDRRRDDLYYMEPAQAAELALARGRRFELDHGYMPFEFMLKLRCQSRVAPEQPFFEVS